MMSKRNVVLLLILFGILFQSCVSKKKFLEMQDGRLKAEEQVRQLTSENNARAERIEALIADFEAMKNELHESNVLKDQYIDSLNHEISDLNALLTQQKESLQETSFSFGFEQQRMKETLDSRERTIRSLESRINTLEKEISDQTSVMDEKDYQQTLLNDKISSLEAERTRGERQREELEQELQRVKAEANALNAEIKEKDATITRLQNNVKLLKDQLGK